MASQQLSMASDQLLSKSLLNPLTFSLLCPIAFSAYSSFKNSMLPLLLRPIASSPKPPFLTRKVASSPESIPPLLHPIASSPKPPLLRVAASSLVAFSTYRSFNSVPPAFSTYRCSNSMPAFSAYRCFNSIPPLLHPVASSSEPIPPLLRPKSPLLGLAASSLIAFYAYRSFNTVPAFSAYPRFNSMLHLIRPITYRMPEKKNDRNLEANFKDWDTGRFNQVDTKETKDSLCIRTTRFFIRENYLTIYVDDQNHLIISDQSRLIHKEDLSGKNFDIRGIRVNSWRDGLEVEVVIPKKKERKKLI